ncbi:protein kinase domain-containing protein [Streptomyces sp. SudanB25_2051]|uniref:protein kinase domain-containing protein n=1 Tax=Streptomyces sp. SudanB25_2051 TaxID=3035275 RepID=UPI003F5718FE
MSDQRPSPSSSSSSAPYEGYSGHLGHEAVLREAGAAPLRPSDPPRIGPYVPLGVLGSGGMGRVYLALPPAGGGTGTGAAPGPGAGGGLAAVKVIRPEYAEDPEFRRRFEREAAVQASVHTPHAPRFQGTGFHDELLWLAADFVPGYSLSDAVREYGALGPAAAWRIVADLGRALMALGAAGVVHRDLKPSNVLLSVRGAHVIDFGISKSSGASMLTATDSRVGTPAFMAPEYLRTGHTDAASDVFSLGGTLVYAVSGRGPFGLGTGMDVMHRVVYEEPDPQVIGAVAAADPALGALLAACLAKDPAHRPTPAQLVTAAPAASGPAWPDALRARVTARKAAYDALTRLPAPVPAPAPSRPQPPTAPYGYPHPAHAPDGHTPAGPVPTPARAPHTPPYPSGITPTPPLTTPPPYGETPPARSGGRTRTRAYLAVAAALTVCAVAVSAYLFTRPEGPAAPPAAAGAPSAPAAAPVAEGGAPDDAAASPLASPTGDPSPSTAPTPPPGSAAPSPSRAEPRPTVTVTAPPARPTPTPAPATSPTPAPKPAWITGCTFYDGTQTTRYGDKNVRVTQVQCMLTKRGYGVGEAGVDGDFGTATKDAVLAFQRAKGLEADGIVGPRTWAALRSTT